MAKIRAGIRGLPPLAKAAIAKQLIGTRLEKFGKIRVFPIGIPADEWIVSVLPSSDANAKRIIDGLLARGLNRFEVFPYGIINPEIGRIDVTVNAGRR